MWYPTRRKPRPGALLAAEVGRQILARSSQWRVVTAVKELAKRAGLRASDSHTVSRRDYRHPNSGEMADVFIDGAGHLPVTDARPHNSAYNMQNSWPTSLSIVLSPPPAHGQDISMLTARGLAPVSKVERIASSKSMMRPTLSKSRFPGTCGFHIWHAWTDIYTIPRPTAKVAGVIC